MDPKQSEGDLHSEAEKYPRKIVQYLRDKNDPYDITINVGNKSFHLHKEVLSTSSPYFKAMFTNNLLESKEPIVTLHDLDQDAMEIIVDLAYTVTTLAQLNISDSNVQSLLAASTLLQVDQVKIECCDYIKRNLDPSNCVGIGDIAERYSCRDLFDCAKAFIIDNFQDVVEHKEFLALSAKTFTEIISADTLNVKFEETVYEAVTKWAACFDHGDRIAHLPTLIKHVRWNQVDTNYLVEHLTEVNRHTVWNQVDTRYMYEDEIQSRQFSLAYDLQTTWKLRSRHRLSNIKSCEKLYLADYSYLYSYDPKTHEWIRLTTKLGYDRGVSYMAALKDELYTLDRGWVNRYYRSNNLYKSNQDTREPHPAYKRKNAAFATLNGLLYFIGGEPAYGSKGEGSNLVDRFDPANNTWKSCAPLKEARYELKATVLDGYIYVIGGSNRRRPITSVERYDPRHDEWRCVGSMESWCQNFGCTSSNGYIYIVGEGSQFKRYDPQKDLWETIPNPNLFHYDLTFCLATIDGLIYTVDKWGVKVYVPDEKRWYLSARIPLDDPSGLYGTFDVQSISAIQ